MAEHVPQSDLRRADAPLGGWREATEPDGEILGSIDDAAARAKTEQSHIDGTLAAYDRFENAVRESEVDDMGGRHHGGGRRHDRRLIDDGRIRRRTMPTAS